MFYAGDFPTSHAAVCIPFDSFAAATGASSATSNFVAGDVLVYKDGGTTQRTSSSGIVVSTSFDSQTGLQMITIDLSDNTDAGFYAAGHEYQVGVADITIDSQTVRFWAATFSIERAGGVLALIKGNAIKVDVNTIKTNPVVNGGTVTFPTGATLASTTNITAGTITTTTNLTNAPTSGDFTATMKTSIGTAVAASAVASVTGNVGGNVVGSVASVTNRVTANTDQLAGQTVTAAAGVTFPTSVASPTNITAATGITVATNGDKTGYALTSAYDPAKTAAQAGDAMTLTSGERTTLAAAIWNALTSGLTTVASIGKLLVDNINATISSRLATTSYTAPLTAAGVRSAVGLASANLDTQLAGIDTDVLTRAAPADAMTLTGAYDSAKTAAQAGDAMTLTSGERTTLAASVWNALTSGLTAVGSIGKRLADDIDAAISSRLAGGSYTAAPTAAENADKLLGRNLAGGSDGGRMVKDALRPLRNKTAIAGGTLTVKEEDDTTTAWTANVSTSPGDPLVSVDPA